MPDNSPIGLFDSGVGGTTVLSAVRARLPDEPLLYLADQARVPYGPNDEATLRRYSAENTVWLLERGAKLIVVACNTASAAALSWLRKQWPAVPFVGMVPAVKPAAQQSRTRVVGVLATPATMQGRLLREVLARWTDGVTVVEQVAPGLVDLIEGGQLESKAMRELLGSYLRPIRAAGADSLVLGCTHYPYLVPLIRELAPELTIVDSSQAVAEQAARLLAAHDLAAPTGDATLSYATTGPVEPFRTFIARYGLPVGEVIAAVGHPATSDGAAAQTTMTE